ncbi:MAG: TetR family transcriptional regulator [Bacteroidales bacterium]|nr:TetR family transcriptional regulator [Bacteroidales bacterium]
MSTKEEMIQNEVITAAQGLFQKYGYSKTTMEDIAKAMGRGKSTLYYYYKSKEEIFEAVIIKEADEVVYTILEKTKQKTTAEDKLKAYLTASLEGIKAKMNLYAAIRKELLDAKDISFNHKHLRTPIMQYNTREIQVVKEILHLGLKNKEFTTSISEDVDLIAYTVVTAIRSIAMDLTLNEKDLHPFFDVEKMNIMITILLRGLKS